MKKLISFGIVFLMIIQFSTVFATDVKLVNAKPQWYSFVFNIFKSKETEKAKEVITEESSKLVAKDGNLSVIKNVSTSGEFSYFSEDNSKVNFEIASSPQNGTVKISSTSPKFTYTPNENYVGSDMFTYLVICDGIKSSAVVNINITESDNKTNNSIIKNAPKFRYEDTINHWGNYAACCLAEKGIMVGDNICGKYYFYPDKLVNRAEFTVLLISALGIDCSKYHEMANPFYDYSEIPYWVNEYAKAAFDAKIINGDYENGKVYFRPFDSLTRIEAIKICDKVINPNNSLNQSDYTDMYLVPSWGEEAVSNMKNYGIINGFDDNTCRPYVKMNRAMTAEFICKILDYKNENPSMMEKIYKELN